MKIELTGEALIKPHDLSLKEELAWRYYRFNEPLGWKALVCGDAVIITDESDDLGNGIAFPDLDSFLDWLKEDATQKLEDDPASFLEASGAVLGLLLTEGVIDAALHEIAYYG